MASFKCKYADVKEIFDWYEKYADDKAKECNQTAQLREQRLETCAQQLCAQTATR